MKVALVTYALNIGGMESFLFGLASRLRAEGVSVTFVVTQSVGAWHDRPSQDGFQIRSILPRDWESRRAHARRVAASLQPFDAIILNHSLAAQGALGLLPESTVAITVLHNNDEPVYALGLGGLANVDMIVAVSEGVRDEAVRRGSPEEKTVCIRNGVDVFSSYPKMSKEQPELKAVFVGRVDHVQKGVLYLPGIVSKAAATGASVSFDIVGAGAEDFETLKERLKEFEQSGRVRIHGALPHDEAMRLLQSSDVILMPSHYEGQPIILFEAMARGVVPIVSLLPGITDAVITHGENGMLVPVGDEAKFSDALTEVGSNRALLDSMSRAAWQSALDNFSSETMTRKYLQLIDICRDKRQRGMVPRRTGRLSHEVLGLRAFFPSIAYKIPGKLRQLLQD